jgi:hypothetical protein
MSARGGNAADTNDPSWTAWKPIASPGGSVAIRSRYVQYKADLSTTAPALTPALQDVAFTYGTTSSDIVAAAVPVGACISTAHACVAIPVNFTRTDATPVRAYSAVVHLSPELAACGAGLTQGTYLNSVGFSVFKVVDRGGGVYQVDESIFGGTCGATGDGTLFTLHLGSAAASGTGTVTLDSVRVRDCDNAPVPGDAGAPASLPIDNTAPAALTGLTAALGTVGSDHDGRLALTVSFTPPGDGSAVEVYRKAYGNYPGYGPGGSVPPTPADYPPSGWTATAVTASGQSDDPPARDFWYYVAYTLDDCGNMTASPVSGGALNYLLGDVVDGVSECAGNNLVDMADVSLLGTNYGRPVGPGGAPACLDVGPTTDYARRSRPVPDGLVEFEDLVLFALNYGWTGSAPGVLPVARGGGRVLAAATADAVALAVPALPAVGGTFAVAVQASGAGDLQALSLALAYDPAVVEMMGAEAGPLLAAQAAPAVVLSPRAGRVDLALLGSGAGLTGAGELATVRFRVLATGDPQLGIAAAEGRDGSNQKVAVGRTVAVAAALPTVTQLKGATPNPFSQTATLSFSLAQGGPVELAIYSVGGRRVRTLARDVREPGEYSVVWNGRDDGGNAVAAGVYYAYLLTAQGRFHRTITYLK